MATRIHCLPPKRSIPTQKIFRYSTHNEKKEEYFNHHLSRVEAKAQLTWSKLFRSPVLCIKHTTIHYAYYHTCLFHFVIQLVSRHRSALLVQRNLCQIICILFCIRGGVAQDCHMTQRARVRVQRWSYVKITTHALVCLSVHVGKSLSDKFTVKCTHTTAYWLSVSHIACLQFQI